MMIQVAQEAVSQENDQDAQLFLAMLYLLRIVSGMIERRSLSNM